MPNRSSIAALLTLAVAGLTGSASLAQTTADKHLQAVARKALHYSDPYHLQPWQRAGYQRALKSCRTARVFVTQYYPSEGYDSRHTASGAPVSLRVAAANRLRQGSFLWIVKPPHLRQVLDTGSHRNDRVADRRGCFAWVDLWCPRPGWRGMDTMVTEAVIIP